MGTQLEELIKEFDSNKDGVLQLDEFKIDLLRNRLESIQRAEKEVEREERRLAPRLPGFRTRRTRSRPNSGPRISTLGWDPGCWHVPRTSCHFAMAPSMGDSFWHRCRCLATSWARRCSCS